MHARVHRPPQGLAGSGAGKGLGLYPTKGHWGDRSKPTRLVIERQTWYEKCGYLDSLAELYSTSS